MVTTATSPTGAGVTSDLINWMKSIFGSAFRVSRGYSTGHDGIDLPAPIGTPVYALSSGIVSYAKNAAADPNAGNAWAIGGGNVVNIDIGGKLTTQYAHLNEIKVKVGQYVEKGQLIGTVGKTGFDIGGSHLHFGLWDRNINKMINPDNYFNALGDTGGKTFADVLRELGISSDPTHVITASEADKIAGKYGQVYGVSGSILDSIAKTFEGKTVSDAAKGNDFNFDPVGAVEDGVAAIGQQLADTFTWIGIIIVGVVFVIGGIILARPSSKEEE